MWYSVTPHLCHISAAAILYHVLHILGMAALLDQLQHHGA